jgi:hypothetical protein
MHMMNIFGKKPDTFDEDKAKELLSIIKWLVKFGAMLCIYFAVAYVFDSINPIRGLIEILFFALFWRFFISDKKL